MILDIILIILILTLWFFIGIIIQHGTEITNRYLRILLMGPLCIILLIIRKSILYGKNIKKIWNQS